MYHPLQQESNEMVIQFSSNNVDQQPHKDLILHHCDSSLLHKKLVLPPDKKIFSGNNNNNDRSNNKVAHRDIERQRRKQMATLHSSLRSLLPLHFIKGKRSISDQIKEAVNYINQLQNNVKELTAKRDNLKKFSSSSIITTNNSLAHGVAENPHEKNHVAASSSTRSFSVQLNNIGGDDEGMIEITCCCNYSNREREEQVVPLSKLLKLVIQEGLHVVNSLSTQNNAILIHTLHCQVKSNNSVDLSELRSKLVSEISSII